MCVCAGSRIVWVIEASYGYEKIWGINPSLGPMSFWSSLMAHSEKTASLTIIFIDVFLRSESLDSPALQIHCAQIFIADLVEVNLIPLSPCAAPFIEIDGGGCRCWPYRSQQLEISAWLVIISTVDC